MKELRALVGECQGPPAPVVQSPAAVPPLPPLEPAECPSWLKSFVRVIGWGDAGRAVGHQLRYAAYGDEDAQKRAQVEWQKFSGMQLITQGGEGAGTIAGGTLGKGIGKASVVAGAIATAVDGVCTLGNFATGGTGE